MTVAARRKYIIDRLADLTDRQVDAIYTIISEFKKDEFVSPLGITTEAQLWDHIDHSLAQAKAGEGWDADDVIDELLREYA